MVRRTIAPFSLARFISSSVTVSPFAATGSPSVSRTSSVSFRPMRKEYRRAPVMRTVVSLFSGRGRGDGHLFLFCFGQARFAAGQAEHYEVVRPRKNFSERKLAFSRDYGKNIELIVEYYVCNMPEILAFFAVSGQIYGRNRLRRIAHDERVGVSDGDRAAFARRYFRRFENLFFAVVLVVHKDFERFDLFAVGGRYHSADGAAHGRGREREHLASYQFACFHSSASGLILRYTYAGAGRNMSALSEHYPLDKNAPAYYNSLCASAK